MYKSSNALYDIIMAMCMSLLIGGGVVPEAWSKTSERGRFSSSVTCFCQRVIDYVLIVQHAHVRFVNFVKPHTLVTFETCQW